MDIGIVKYTPEGTAQFGFSAGKGTSRGIHQLVGLVATHLLTQPGTHAPDATMGTGLIESLYQAGNNKDKLATATQLGLQKVTADILQSQASEPQLPQDARLKALTVVDLRAGNGKVFIELQVTNESGESANVTL